MLGRTELIAVRHKADRIPLSRTTSLPVKSSLPSGAAASMLAIPFSPRPRRCTAWYPYADSLGSCRTGGVRRSIDRSVLQTGWFMALFFTILISVSLASYRFFESPLQKRLRALMRGTEVFRDGDSKHQALEP